MAGPGRTLSSHYTQDPLEIPEYQAFARAVAAGTGIAEAAREQGFSPSQGGRLLRNPRVLALVTRLRAEYAEALEITQDDVVHGILSAIDDARALSEPATQIMGWNSVAKIKGLVAPEKKELLVNGRVEVTERRLQNMPTSQLLDIIEKAERGEILEAEYEQCQHQPPEPGDPTSGASSAGPSAPPSSSSSSSTVSAAPSASSASALAKKKSSASSSRSAGSKGRNANARTGS